MRVIRLTIGATNSLLLDEHVFFKALFTALLIIVSKPDNFRVFVYPILFYSPVHGITDAVKAYITIRQYWKM